MSEAPGHNLPAHTARRSAGASWRGLGALWRCAPLLLACTGAWAQAGGAAPSTLDAERARIAAERARADQRYAAEEIACQKRFAVTDCVERARTAQRAVRADLQRQEVMLNDTQRRRKADVQQKRLQDKQREREADAAARTTRAPQAAGSAPSPNGRLPSDPKPPASHAQQTAEHEAMMLDKRASHEADEARRAAMAAGAAEEERRYTERQREAAEYKARVLQRNAKGGAEKPAAPLPAPP